LGRPRMPSCIGSPRKIEPPGEPGGRESEE
jgi:hypothetical protein